MYTDEFEPEMLEDLLDKLSSAPLLESFTLAELEDLPLPEVSWHVDGLIPAGALVLLAGRPKAGKSLLAIDLLASIATGTAFLGRATEPGRVLYAPAEDALSLVRERLFTRMGNDRDAPFTILPADGSLGQYIQLDNEKSTFRFVSTVHSIKPRIMVLDPFRELHRGSENEADAMAKVLQPLRRIAHQGGCTVVLIHHRNKHASDPSLAIRGSSAIAGAVDMIITLDTPGDTIDLGNGQLLTLHVEGRYGPRTRLSARLSEGLRWEAVDAVETVDESASERVLGLLKACGAAMTADQIVLETGLAKKTVQNAFTSLRAAGQIERGQTEGRSTTYRYAGSSEESPAPDQPAPVTQPTFDPF